jgi:hypothetical protein
VAGAVIVEVDNGETLLDPGEQRVELLAVLPSLDNTEVEVHLAYAGLRTVGRARAGMGPVESAAATIEALRALRLSVPYGVAAASVLSDGTGEAVVVVLGPDSHGGNRYGIATGKNPDEAAARATLHALNRALAPRPA